MSNEPTKHRRKGCIACIAAIVVLLPFVYVLSYPLAMKWGGSKVYGASFYNPVVKYWGLGPFEPACTAWERACGASGDVSLDFFVRSAHKRNHRFDN